jgi:hypothetical protein
MPSLRGVRVLGLLDGREATPPETTLEVEDDAKKKIIMPNPPMRPGWLGTNMCLGSF